MARHRLRVPRPYDASRLLRFLGAHAVPGVEHWDGATYTRSVRTPAGAAVVAVTATADGVDIAIMAAADQEPAVLQRFEHLLSLTTDTSAAEQHLAEDPLVGPSVRARPGLRSPGSLDDAEMLVRTVVGQQVSLAGARAVLARIAAELGEPVGPQLGSAPVLTLFPAMAVLAAVDPLRLPMPQARARAVVACAGAVTAAGGLPSRTELLALPGVGPWTADYVDLRCRQDPDVFLPTDLAVRRVLERGGCDSSARAAATRAEGWAPYRSTALIHLWTDYLEGPSGNKALAVSADSDSMVMGRPR